MGRRAPAGGGSAGRGPVRCVVLLKGDGSLIAAPGKGVLVDGGAPILATAGTGDVLTGIVAAFLAKGMDARLATAAAATAHHWAAMETSYEAGLMRATCSTRCRRCSPARSQCIARRSRSTSAPSAATCGGCGACSGRCELWAVVKADGYGHGAIDVAGAALGEGAQALCVATVPEALPLRREFPGVRILVMGPTSGREIAQAREADLDLAVSDEAVPEGVRVHLKLDTGMGRWGLSELPAPPVRSSG